MKLLLCGPRGAGKSTLIRRLLAGEETVYGFETFFAADGDGSSGLYIRRAFDGQAHPGPESRVGERGPRPGNAVGFPQVFDTRGAALLRDIPAGATVVMDELGYLERDAALFLRQVTAVLSGPFHVIGAIKPVELPHLQAIRFLPGVTTLFLTEENRETCFASARRLLEEVRRNQTNF